MTCSSDNRTRLVIAGGGTGGHVFPGIAVAEAMSEMTLLDVLWIGTGRDVEVDAIANTPWMHKTLNVLPMKGTGLAKKLKAALTLPAASVRAMTWLKHFKPHMVLGVGGYVSGPVMLAARSFNVPAAIHEQNSVPGLANRLAARFARKVFITYRESAGYFRDVEVELTGNPVRNAILRASGNTGHESGHPPCILILGGSQGAIGLNRIASAAVRTLWQSGKKIMVIHQTGASAEAEMREYYKKEGIKIELKPFIKDMARVYMRADLVICRAGATTLAELTVLGKPSILIPYPFAADNHQEKNAKAMTMAGASVSFRECDIGAVRLAGEIENIIMDHTRSAAMANAAVRLGRREAARHIAMELMKLGGRREQLGQQQKSTDIAGDSGLFCRAGV